MNGLPAHALPVLYSFRRCPYAMRARLALLACGVRVEIREVRLRNKPPSLLAVSPKGTVPVLCLPDGRVIDQSLDIMRWAVGQAFPEKWLRVPAAEQSEAEAWLTLLDGPFKFHLDRYKYPNRYDDCDPVPHQEACVEILTGWDACLVRRGAFLLGAKPSLYDYAMLPFVRQFRIADEAWFDAQVDFPNVQAWLEAWMRSDVFDAAMPRLEPWQQGDAAVFFPR